MNRIAEEVKQQLSMKQVLERYGFPIGGKGTMTCPFHQDDTPSLKVYEGDRGWHCFGCGRGGSVLDFVMLLYGLTFRQALVRLDNDFRLGLLDGERDDQREAIRRAQERTERRRAREEWERRYASLWRRYALIDQNLSRNPATERTAGLRAALMGKAEYLWQAIQEVRETRDRG